MSHPKNLKHRSAAVTQGPNRAPTRAALRSMGLTDADLARPFVAVANTWNEVTPCQLNLDSIGKRVKDGIRAAVVSMPCWELFEKQSKQYQDAVLGSVPRVAVEAAVQFGWERWLGARGAFVGMTGFGASAPVEALYPHFGITPERVAAAARSLL